MCTLTPIRFIVQLLYMSRLHIVCIVLIKYIYYTALIVELLFWEQVVVALPVPHYNQVEWHLNCKT